MAKLETAQKIFKDLDAFGKITQDKGAGELFVIFLDEYTRIKNKHLK